LHRRKTEATGEALQGLGWVCPVGKPAVLSICLGQFFAAKSGSWLHGPTVHQKFEGFLSVQMNQYDLQ